MSSMFSLLLVLLFSVAAAQSNPFRGKRLYVPSYWTDEVRETARTAPTAADRALIRSLSGVSTAFWVDKMSVAHPGNRSDTRTLVGALTDAASKGSPIVTIVIYDVPNRDCGAAASAGEICCLKRADGTCDMTFDRDCHGGTAEYRHSYIDVIANTVREFCDTVPMAFVIEPDSLPNLVTNLGNPNCGSLSTRISYRTSIAYAVRTLHAACPSAPKYLDAAHGRWLGWEANAEGYVAEVKAMNVSHLLRGFATNVANYNPLGMACPKFGICLDDDDDDDGKEKEKEAKCCSPDPCELSGHNPGFTEFMYVQELALKFRRAIPGFRPRFVIDTARNGATLGPDQCRGTWCNYRDGGVGTRPTARTRNYLVDAFLWIKPPSQSDGCTKFLADGSQCPRFDEACAADDAVGSRAGEPRAPEAGDLFKYQFLQLARNGIRV